MSPSDKTMHIVPPSEMRCVWMAAGVISYQLCDREFECDDCPLDAAIRNHLPRAVARDHPGGGRAICKVEGRLPDDRLYSRNHCWTKDLGSGLIQVGIEPGLGGALLTPKAIVFPSAGQRVFRGQTCLWIVMEGGTLPVESPLDGVIRSANSQLAKQPHLLGSQSLDDGWLFEMETEASPAKGEDLLGKEQAVVQFAADKDRFLSSLQNAVSGGHHSVGVTLADGGQRLQNVADMIGSSRYFALLRKAFH